MNQNKQDPVEPGQGEGVRETSPLEDISVASQSGIDTSHESGDSADYHVRRERFLELLASPSPRRTTLLGVIGAAIFFGVWELGHYLTPESGQRFLPAVEEVVGRLLYLYAEKDFAKDVLISCMRIFGSFLAACIIAVPLGIAMGCFANVRALVNPTVSGWRYLPAASFIPLLLVWFGPTETAKMGLLFMGVIFFLIAMVLDDTAAVQREFIEAALTMGAKRWRIVLGVVVPAAAPAIVDSMRTMIAVGWTYLVIAEIVGAQDGIGAVMMRSGRFLHVDTIMAGILMIGILGVMTDLLFRLAAHLLFPWNAERKV
jgi:NitT/TauT family transport system permease protein